MEYKGRAQCIIIRRNKILVVKPLHGDDYWYCLPGGGIEIGETPEQAAIRELKEECLVSGEIIKKTSEYIDPCDDNNIFYKFLIDIGNQSPSLGVDPEVKGEPILVDIKWMALNELCEKDRVYL